MEVLREFLESSTIHGLSYISTAKVSTLNNPDRYIFDYSLISQSTFAKLAWVLIVILGFLGAGFLINKSYSGWQESPISTSISTHPIADLDLPTVTVCPPKGSRTALYYDLMKADNNSLTEENREELKEL